MIQKKLIGDHAFFSFEENDRLNVKNINLFKIKVLRSVINPKVNTIVIDLKGLDFMDSEGAKGLVTLRKFAKRKQKKFYLRNISSEFNEIIKLLNIDKDFEIYQEL